MLLRTDPATKTISMLSFPRDMLVNVHCPGQAGLTREDQLRVRELRREGDGADRVSDLIGLPINYLITVNFRGFKQIVNRLGGVWIDIDRRYFNDNAGLSPTFGYAKINLQPGYQLLTGGSALDYVRYRHTDSDLYRVARQQQFVKAMKYQFAHNFSVLKVPKIVGALTKNIEVGVGRRRGASRAEDHPQLRAVRLPPAAGPLLPDADPGSDRLLRPDAPTRRTSSRRPGLVDTRRRGGAASRPRRAGPQGEDEDACARARRRSPS